MYCHRHCVSDGLVPKLRADTVEEHRPAVRDATLDATARLVTEHGLASVTMSKIAAETGVGRATLYKYFPDVEAILVAWHERQIGSHLKHLARVRDQSGDVARRLEAVLEAYALMTYERPHGTELAVLLHRGERQDRRCPRRRGTWRTGGLLHPRPDRGRPPAVQGRGPPTRHRHPRRAAPPPERRLSGCVLEAKSLVIKRVPG